VITSTIPLPQVWVQLEGCVGAVQVWCETSQRTLPPPITQPTPPVETLKLVSESAACVEGRKAPAGTFGATVTVVVLVMYFGWYLVTVTILIFGLV
jgi:hypothetical protein